MPIYRVRSESGREFYVEEHKVPGGLEDTKPEGEWVYVVTRSQYSTSIYGQIESLGWLEAAKLEPLNMKRKKDREIEKRIREAQQQGKERSQMWFDIYKAQEGQHDRQQRESG